MKKQMDKPSIPLATEVKADNGGKFEDAYNHAIKVLQQYIDKIENDAEKSELISDDTVYKHRKWKAQFMTTAKRTIEENYKMYLAHPELFKK